MLRKVGYVLSATRQTEWSKSKPRFPTSLSRNDSIGTEAPASFVAATPSSQHVSAAPSPRVEPGPKRCAIGSPRRGRRSHGEFRASDPTVSFRRLVERGVCPPLFHKPRLRERIVREEIQQELAHFFPAGLARMHAVAAEIAGHPNQRVDLPSFRAFGPEVGAPEQER